MKPMLLTDIFSVEDMEKLNNCFDYAEGDSVQTNKEHAELGRKSVHKIDIHLSVDINKLGQKILGENFHCVGLNMVEYSSEYGEPNLPPHYDRDSSELIINYQLSSNISWGIGVDEEVYLLEDNQAVAFHPNKSIHWRPIREFKPGEFVRMAFIRYQDINNPIEYSELPHDPKDETFAKIHEIRNNLK